MEQKDKFIGAYKTFRGSYKEFKNLVALWFGGYRITKEKIKGIEVFIIWDKHYKKIFTLKIL